MSSYQRLNRPGALKAPKSVQTSNNTNQTTEGYFKSSLNTPSIPTSKFPLVLSKRDINRILPSVGDNSSFPVLAPEINNHSDSDVTIIKRKRRNHGELVPDYITDSYSADDELDELDDEDNDGDILALDLNLHGENQNPSGTTSELTNNSRVILKSTPLTSVSGAFENDQKLTSLHLPTSIPPSVEHDTFRKIVQVKIKPQGEPLLSNQAKLLLQGISRSCVQEASPFFRCLEYNPNCPTYETILLCILRDEMSLLDSDDKSSSNISIRSIIVGFFYRLTHFGDLNGEDYLQKYPWERYYDLADWLFQKRLRETDVEPGLREINRDVAPIGYELNTSDPTPMKRSYEYVVKSQD